MLRLLYWVLTTLEFPLLKWMFYLILIEIIDLILLDDLMKAFYLHIVFTILLAHVYTSARSESGIRLDEVRINESAHAIDLFCRTEALADVFKMSRNPHPFQISYRSIGGRNEDVFSHIE